MTVLKYVFLVWAAVLFCVPAVAGGNDGTRVFRVEIREEIGPEVWRLVKKSFEKAREENADCILIDMNTYGGMVVYADSLRSLILDCPLPVWVFIDNNAASAGALIAIACDRIYMKEGANIGAATVVSQAGEAMPDKYQSYMRSMIRATAQAQGADTVVRGRDTLVRWRRDPRIAEAMVDPSLKIEGVSDSGKVVTFTPHEAMRYGFCDGIAASEEEVLSREGVEDYTVFTYSPTLSDKIIGFLINPVVQGLLIMLIIGGIYFELQTPGIGFPLIASLTGCILYFAPLYIEGIADYGDILLFAAGGVLLLLEFFVLPGFGVAGIAGVVCVIAGMVLAGIDDVSFEFFGDFAGLLLRSLFLVVGCSLAALVLSIWGGSRLFASRRWGFALRAEQRAEEGYVGVDLSVGKEVESTGVACTDLRPSGKVRIGDEVYDAVAVEGKYIVKGRAVKVTGFQAGQLYVREL